MSFPLDTKISGILKALHAEAQDEGWRDAQYSVASDDGKIEDIEDERWDTDVEKYVTQVMDAIKLHIATAEEEEG